MQKQPAFDPDLLIEEDCDIVEVPSSHQIVDDDDDEDDDADVFDDDEDIHLTNASGNNTKAIYQRKNRRRMCKSRYSSSRNGGRKRPAGKADNDPTEDAMYVSEEDVDDLIETDED